MKQLRTAIDQGHVVLDLDPSDITSAIRGSVRHMVANRIIPEQAVDQVAAAFVEREREVPTAIGHAVADRSAACFRAALRTTSFSPPTVR